MPRHCSIRKPGTRGLVSAIAALSCLPQAAALAQQIRGELSVQGSGGPLAYAFVILRDSTGAELARARTDAFGRFILEVPGPGVYRLQTAIIGTRSRTSPPITLTASDTLSYSMEVPLLPVRLDAVVVSGERRCEVEQDAGNAVAQVWEEARKALSAVSWTQQSDSLWYQIIHYTRRLNPGSLRPVSGRASRRSGVALGSPFASAPAHELSETGYVRPSTDGGWEHFGPDADVLLSEAFANDHCFYLRQHPDDTALLGLAFEPVRQRDVPDLEGVLWLDKETAHLRFLDFEYVRLPWPVRSRHVGGHVEFEQIPTGPWIVRHWWLRMPQLTRRGVREPRITQFRETGGFVVQYEHAEQSTAVASAESPGDPEEEGEPDTEWRNAAIEDPSSLPVVRGVAAEVTSGGPVAQATVLLVGPSDTAYAVELSSQQGWFQFTAPDTGRFRVVVSRAGHRSVSSEPLDLSIGQTIDLHANLQPIRTVRTDSTALMQPDSATSRDVATFIERRESGLTLFSFTKSEIEERASKTLLSLIVTLPGIRMVGPPSARIVSLNGLTCPPGVYIDGHPAASWIFLIALPIDWVQGVEIFPTSAETPAAYVPVDRVAPECGTVLIWTVGVA